MGFGRDFSFASFEGKFASEEGRAWSKQMSV